MKPISYVAVLKYFLPLMVLVVLAGCGSGAGSTTGTTGSISAHLVWPQATAAVATKSAVPAAVSTIRLIISGPGMTTIQLDFPASAGGGTITNIPVGTGRTLTIQGLDAGGTVIYQTVINNIIINSGQTTSLGSVAMQPVQHTVTPTAGAGGSIAPATAQTAGYGTSTSFSITPATGYSIASVSGCGGTLSGSIYTTGLITGDCTVSAAFTSASYSVTPSAGIGGSISPATAQTVGYGNSASFTVTPNSGYSISTVSGCGGILSGTTYTTGAITANCTVSAAFSQLSYTVTPCAGAGGGISPATAQTVGYGGTTSFTVTPNVGYGINTVSGCGGSLSGTTYTTGAITGNCSVSATFSALSYTVTPTAGAGGSISPATAQTVGHGGTTSFTVTPNAGYAISTVTGCGGTLVGSTYTTGAITANCTVSATFAGIGTATFTW